MPGPRARAGFTLIELLMAIVIVGILASIAVRAFWSVKDRGLEASMISDLRTLVAFQEAHHETNYTYTDDLTEFSSFQVSPGVDLEVTFAEADGWAAVATVSGMPKTQCGIVIGEAPLEAAPAAKKPGQAECATVE
jgi:prepilin-type N-terminal cleavage/methylation domain-containing protein